MSDRVDQVVRVTAVHPDNLVDAGRQDRPDAVSAVAAGQDLDEVPLLDRSQGCQPDQQGAPIKAG